MSHLGNAAQLSASTVGLEHEDAQHHKDDDCVDVRGGEGCLQTSTHGIQHHPHGNQNTQSCIQTDRHGFHNSSGFRSSTGMASMCTQGMLAGLQL